MTGILIDYTALKPLRDISKRYPQLIEIELNNWNLEIKEIKQVYKLASKFIK